METHYELKTGTQLSREVKRQESILNAEYITLFDASMKGNKPGRETENPGIKEFTIYPELTGPKKGLIDTIILPVSYDESATECGTKARFLNDLISPYYKNVFKAHLDKGEISLSVTNGQVGDIVYAGDNASGFIWKKVVLSRSYPFPVEIKMMTEARLPSGKETVYKLDTGRLELTYAAAQGSLFNFINYRHDSGSVHSAGHWTPFLTSIKSNRTIFEDNYTNGFTDIVSIIVPPNITSFNIGTVANISVVTSFDTANPSQWSKNYGYGFIDLRSKIDSDISIISNPLTNISKPPAGGIRLSARLEVYKLPG